MADMDVNPKRPRIHIHLPATLMLFLVTPLVNGCDAPVLSWPLWDGHESVADYAKRVNLPPTKTLDLGNGVKLETVLIPAGTFIMGTPEPEKPAVGQTMVGISGFIVFVAALLLLIRAWRKRKRPQFSLAFMLVMMIVASVGVWGGVRWHKALKVVDVGSPEEHPAHVVTLTKPFYMTKYPVTQEQYQQVMGTIPILSDFKRKSIPVETLSWDVAQHFCKSLTEQMRQPVRLPTEAEWEYSCRAGTTTAFYSGNTEKDLNRVAWYDANSKNTTHPVGQKEANAFGLYDMHGNVWQACQDWYGIDYYGKSPVEDPGGPTQGFFHVVRGGSSFMEAGLSRSACRLNYPAQRYVLFYFGFRVVVAVPSTIP